MLPTVFGFRKPPVFMQRLQKEGTVPMLVCLKG